MAARNPGAKSAAIFSRGFHRITDDGQSEWETTCSQLNYFFLSDVDIYLWNNTKYNKVLSNEDVSISWYILFVFGTF